MQYLLGFFYIFSVLQMRASSLECETCTDIDHCSGKMVTCSKIEDTCSVIYTEHNMDGKHIDKVRKGCYDSKRCFDPPVFFHMGEKTVYTSNRVCCEGDGCKNATVGLPVLNKDLNGKQCPACSSESEKCTGEMVNCTGQDTYCFEVTTMATIDGKQVERVMKGCTNQYVCIMITVEPSKTWMRDETVRGAKCISQASRLASLFFSTFTGLFLLKIML